MKNRGSYHRFAINLTTMMMFFHFFFVGFTFFIIFAHI